MKPIPLLTFLAFIILAPVGCGTMPVQEPASKQNRTSRLEAKIDKAGVKTKLMAQYQEWRGSPYEHGGLSKRGVDCSGFVYLTYRNKFGIKLPRSTEQQSRTGIQIPNRQINTGDLLFFRTGLTNTHVGIYLGKRRFLHASTSQGVIISNMDNVYWRDKFWKAQRI